MGQKVDPRGLRLKINKHWASRWYAGPRDYADMLHEDLKLRNTVLKSPLTFGGEISRIDIVRHSDNISLVVNTGRPGVIIGTKGENIEKITKLLQALTKKRVLIKINEENQPEVNSQIVAQNIARLLKTRSAFRRVIKMAMENAMRTGALGIKAKISGRLGGADMSRSVLMIKGRVPLHTLRANIDYGFAESYTTYGSIGVKVWIFKGEIYKYQSDDLNNLLSDRRNQREGRRHQGGGRRNRGEGDSRRTDHSRSQQFSRFSKGSSSPSRSSDRSRPAPLKKETKDRIPAPLDGAPQSSESGTKNTLAAKDTPRRAFNKNTTPTFSKKTDSKHVTAKAPTKATAPKGPTKDTAPKATAPKAPTKATAPKGPTKDTTAKAPTKAPTKATAPKGPTKDTAPKATAPKAPTKATAPKGPTKDTTAKAPTKAPTKATAPKAPTKDTTPKAPTKDTTPKGPTKDTAAKGDAPKGPTKATATAAKAPTKDTAPKGPTKDTTPKGPTKDTTPKGPTKDTTPKGPTKDTAPKGPTKDTTPKGPTKDTTPKGPTKDTAPKGPHKGHRS